jgi:hypothetical protein
VPSSYSKISGGASEGTTEAGKDYAGRWHVSSELGGINMNDFEAAAMRRYEWLLETHPIHNKKDLPPRPTTRLIPVHEKIAQLLEARDCYVERVRSINNELKIYRGEQ